MDQERLPSVGSCSPKLAQERCYGERNVFYLPSQPYDNAWEYLKETRQRHGDILSHSVSVYTEGSREKGTMNILLNVHVELSQRKMPMCEN